METLLILGFITLLSAIVLVYGIKRMRIAQRLKDVSEETDQAKLMEIAQNDKLTDEVREAAAHKIADPILRQELLNGITAYLMRSPMTKPYKAKENTNPNAVRDSMCHARPMDSHGSGHHWQHEESRTDEGIVYDVYKCKHCGMKYHDANPADG